MPHGSNLTQSKKKSKAELHWKNVSTKQMSHVTAQPFQATHQKTTYPVEEIQYRQFADEIQRLQHKFHCQPYYNKHQQYTDDIDADIGQKACNIRLQAFYIQQMINHRIIVFQPNFLSENPADAYSG